MVIEKFKIKKKHIRTEILKVESQKKINHAFINQNKDGEFQQYQTLGKKHGWK